MAIILNGNSYSDTDFSGYGYTSRFPEQLFSDLLAEINSIIVGIDSPTVQDEGVSLPKRAFLNFTGAGVTVTDQGGKTLVTINKGAISISDLANWPAGVSASELAHLDGVVSNIQQQLNGKAAVLHAHSAADVATTPTRRFVTEEEKNIWNSKAAGSHSHAIVGEAWSQAEEDALFGAGYLFVVRMDILGVGPTTSTTASPVTTTTTTTAAPTTTTTAAGTTTTAAPTTTTTAAGTTTTAAGTTTTAAPTTTTTTTTTAAPTTTTTTTTTTGATSYVTDDFNRSNGHPGSNWTTTGTVAIDANVLKGFASGGIAVFTGRAWANNQYAEGGYSLAEYGGPAIRMSTDGANYYSVNSADAGEGYSNIKIMKKKDGVTTYSPVLHSVEGTSNIRLEISGSTITVKYKTSPGGAWSAGAQWTDPSPINSGSAGIVLWPYGGCDDFAAGDL